MNTDLFYTLDPYIIGILFQLDNDEDVLKTYNMLLEDVDKVMQGTFKEYLLENKFQEAEVDSLFVLDDFEKADPKFKPFLQNITLLNKVDANIKELLKAYYDSLLPKITPEKKAELEKYIKDNEKILEEKNKLIRDSLGLMKKILIENNVQSVAELEAQTTDLEKLATGPEINLGGKITGGMTGTVEENNPQVEKSLVEGSSPVKAEVTKIEDIPAPPVPPLDNIVDLNTGSVEQIKPISTLDFEEVPSIGNSPIITNQNTTPPKLETQEKVAPEVVTPQTEEIKFASPITQSEVSPVSDMPVNAAMQGSTGNIISNISSPESVAAPINADTSVPQSNSLAARLDSLGVDLTDATAQK